MRNVLAAFAVLTVGVSSLGCKAPGAITVFLDLPEDCASATHANMTLIANGRCADHAGCFNLGLVCQTNPCTAACEQGPCSIEELGSGLAISPASPGPYAVLFALSAPAEYKDDEPLLNACAEVQLDRDGTADRELVVEATCCELGPPLP